MIIFTMIFLASILVHCAGDYFMKRASIGFTWLDFLSAIGLYTISAPMWLWLLKETKMATLVSASAAINVLVLVVMSVVAFHEHLTTRETIGTILAIAAVAMFYK